MDPTLSKNLSLRNVAALVAAGAAIDANSAIIDTAGYEGVIFVATITGSAATGVATLKVEENSASQDAGMVALAGAVASVTSAANNDLADKLLVIDVYRPRKRYVQAVRTSSVANITFGPVIAILYGARKLPVEPDASVSASASVSSPAAA